MKSGEFGRITLIAIAAAALSACATDEANQSASTTPVSSASGTRAPGGSANASAARQPGAASGKMAGSAALGAPAHTVYYDFDRYDLKPEFRSVVEANAKYLNANTRQSVTIEGDCDERGSREYNLALGQRRADAVKSMLKLLGVAESRMETVSYGEEKPAVQGHDEAAWSKNRRSEIVYKR